MVINPIVGVYIPIIRIPIKGVMTIPNISTFDRGTNFPRQILGMERGPLWPLRFQRVHIVPFQTTTPNNSRLTIAGRFVGGSFFGTFRYMIFHNQSMYRYLQVLTWWQNMVQYLVTIVS